MQVKIRFRFRRNQREISLFIHKCSHRVGKLHGLECMLVKWRIADDRCLFVFEVRSQVRPWINIDNGRYTAKDIYGTVDLKYSLRRLRRMCF
jgi:glutathionylspermidine synthase